MDKQVDIVLKHQELLERAEAVGLELQCSRISFYFDIEGVEGMVTMDALADVELFIHGYELALIEPQ